MKERGILFRGPLVRALLAGDKTQTRRIIKAENLDAPGYGPPYFGEFEGCGALLRDSHQNGQPCQFARCPYGLPGDRLWVRETWQPIWSGDKRPSSLATPDGWRIGYVATDGVQEYHDDDRGLVTTCKPGIHMPRWASRITLPVTEIRIERVQDISEADARAEGIDPVVTTRKCYPSAHAADVEMRDYRAGFRKAWIEILGESSWAANPWVWAISFTVEPHLS